MCQISVISFMFLNGYYDFINWNASYANEPNKNSWWYSYLGIYVFLLREKLHNRTNDKNEHNDKSVVRLTTPPCQPQPFNRRSARQIKVRFSFKVSHFNEFSNILMTSQVEFQILWVRHFFQSANFGGIESAPVLQLTESLQIIALKKGRQQLQT